MSTSVEYTPVSTNDVQNGISTTIPRRIPGTDASHAAYPIRRRLYIDYMDVRVI